MNWKGTLKKAASCICVLALFLGGLHGLSGLMMNKTSYTKYEQFRESEKTFDVLFFGSSHVINGVSPLDLFREYGITSYNFSMHGNYVRSSFYLLEEALRIVEEQGKPLPKAVVLDVYFWEEGIANLDNAWDSFPISETKFSLARTLGEKSERLRLLFPFSIYHSRWTELKKNDFEPALNQWYGVELRYAVKLPASEIITDREDQADVLSEKIEYLDRIKALCEDHGIRLFLINIPYSYNPGWQREANGIYSYAEDRGIPYVNYMNEETGIDFDIDFYDEGHLNPVGMRTLTGILGEYLSEEGMPDHRDEKLAKEWEEEYEAFTSYRIQRLKDTKNLQVFLMALNDPDLYAQVELQEDCLSDLQIGKLIRRLEEKGDLIMTSEERPIVLQGDGTEKAYDIFCEVFRASDNETPVYRAGFVRSEGWEFSEAK